MLPEAQGCLEPCLSATFHNNGLLAQNLESCVRPKLTGSGHREGRKMVVFLYKVPKSLRVTACGCGSLFSRWRCSPACSASVCVFLPPRQVISSARRFPGCVSEHSAATFCMVAEVCSPEPRGVKTCNLPRWLLSKLVTPVYSLPSQLLCILAHLE